MVGSFTYGWSHVDWHDGWWSEGRFGIIWQRPLIWERWAFLRVRLFHIGKLV